MHSGDVRKLVRKLGRNTLRTSFTAIKEAGGVYIKIHNSVLLHKDQLMGSPV